MQFRKLYALLCVIFVGAMWLGLYLGGMKSRKDGLLVGRMEAEDVLHRWSGQLTVLSQEELKSVVPEPPVLFGYCYGRVTGDNLDVSHYNFEEARWDFSLKSQYRNYFGDPVIARDFNRVWQYATRLKEFPKEEAIFLLNYGAFSGSKLEQKLQVPSGYGSMAFCLGVSGKWYVWVSQPTQATNNFTTWLSCIVD